MPKTSDHNIAALAKLVEKGFAAIAADIADIKERMLTKDDLKGFATNDDLKRLATRDEVRVIVREETQAIRDELADLRAEVTDLRSAIVNLTGFRKEIDHALDRIAAIEKHLGLRKKLTAADR
jgi:hypothetical protein